MDTPVTVATISAAAAIVCFSHQFYLTKSKERQADWQRYKFELYKELVQSFSGIVGADSTPEGNRRFASVCNTLHLIGSKGVLNALHSRPASGVPGAAPQTRYRIVIRSNA